MEFNGARIGGVVGLFRRRLVAWFGRVGRDLPWRRTTDPYAILVSELMLQQTQVATVLPYYDRWMRRFPTVESLAGAAGETVLQHWEGLGYYSRALNLHRAARAVCERRDRRFPETIAGLRALPGVGPYTAGAVAAFAFDRPEPLVDGNIARVLARLTDLRLPVDRGPGRKALWKAAASIQPPGSRGGRRFNGALMELGALICKPGRPDCGHCPVRAHCRAERPESLPIKRPRPKVRERIEDRAWIVRGDGSYLVGREAGNRWRGLWVLPILKTPPRDGIPALVVKHPVMNERITLRVWKARCRKARPEERWVMRRDAAGVPMPAPHRKVAGRLLSA